MSEEAILLDTNLAVLLIVGNTDPGLIRSHKRLDRYTTGHYKLLVELIGGFSDLVFIPHVMAEAFNLARQIGGPAGTAVRRTFRLLVEAATEIPVPSATAVGHGSFTTLGLTDAALLSAAELGRGMTLATADRMLAGHARSLSIPVEDLSGL